MIFNNCSRVISLLILTSLLTSSKSNDQCRNFDSTYEMSTSQQELCRNEGIHIIEAVKAIAEVEFRRQCQFSLRQKSWNCTGISAAVFPGRSRFMSESPWVYKLTKETAFAQALTSATIAYEVAKDCRNGLYGDTMSCYCFLPTGPLEENYEWNCSDDIGYGTELTKSILDDTWKRDLDLILPNKADDYRKEQKMIHLHNFEAGRQAILQNRRKICRCHGSTTSCTIKTCTLDMPDISEITNQLETKYETAKQVTVKKSRQGLPEELEIVEGDRVSGVRHPKGSDLVFSEVSPSYCQPLRSYGALGVSGRECYNKTPPLENNRGKCSEICCNGIRNSTVHQERLCACIALPDGRTLCEAKCKEEHTVYTCL